MNESEEEKAQCDVLVGLLVKVVAHTLIIGGHLLTFLSGVLVGWLL